MVGTRLGSWLVLASVAAWACAAGGDGPVSTGAFTSDPTTGSSSTGPASTSEPEASSTSPAEVTGDPPPGASCCQVAPTPGCGDEDVEACVCTLEPMCCQSVWSQDCVDLAIMPCNDPTCGAPSDTTGGPGDGSSSGGPPTLSCDALAMQEGWMYWRCQADGGIQCNGMGTPTTDCDFCCGYCNEPGDVSCGDLATMNGWGAANCEWNGNGACGGSGTPTCDCSFCCQVN
jgi:hypothetical protein